LCHAVVGDVGSSTDAFRAYFGLGTGITFGNGYVLDACPELGFGYDIDGKNTIGLAFFVTF